MKLLIILSVFLANQLTFTQNIDWSEQQSGVTSKLNSISNSLKYSNFWICGSNRVVLWTNNYGDNWLNVSSNLPAGINLNCISAIDTNTAITSGNIGTNTFVFKTTNKGQTWDQVFYQEGGYIISISKNADYLVGNPVNGRWSIWKSINTGNSWDSAGLYLQQNGNEHGWNNSVCFNGNGDVWIGTNNFRIYHYSYSSGWNIQSMPEQNIFTVRLSYSSYELFAGGNHLYRTTNNGNNWVEIPSPGTGAINGIAVPVYIIPIPLIDNIYYDVFITRDNSEIYNVKNTGANLTYTAETGEYTSLLGITMGIFGLRDNGGITAGFFQILVGGPDPNYPYSFELKQNFPNPFNPKTKIPVSIYKSTNLNISIYNIAGEFVTTIFNGNIDPLLILDNSDYYVMSHYFEWDASNYPTGVYFYRVTADDYKETRKMVLVK
jgi:hypothetical protein